MKIVIQTQYMENYSFHANDNTCPMREDRWKYKGGNEYVIKNVNTKNETAIEELIKKAESRICHDGPGSREYILGWELVGDEELTPYEKSQLDIEGRVTWPATVIDI